MLQALAIVAGISTSLLARSAIAGAVPERWATSAGLVALGLLASGGSGFWNAILSYVLQVKDIKKVEAEGKSAELTLPPARSVLRPLVR